MTASTDESGALMAAMMIALEGLCFVSVDGFVPHPPAAGPTVTATVEFRGPERGQVSLTVPSALLEALFGDLLGEASPEAYRDGLRELTNIVCGNVVPRIFPPAVYELGTPTVGAAPSAPARATVIVLAAGGWLGAELHTEVGS